MVPGVYDLTGDNALYRGDTLEGLSVLITDDAGVAIPLTGKTWRAQVRETVDSTAILLTFTVGTTDAADGILLVSLPATQWDDADIPDEAPVDKWYWDLESTDGAVVRTWLRGKVKVIGDVSRAVA